MAATLKSIPLPQETANLRVNGSASPAALDVLSRVTVLRDVVTIEGDDVRAGSTGTIVAVWDRGDLYDVDFAEVYGPATISAELLQPL